MSRFLPSSPHTSRPQPPRLQTRPRPRRWCQHGSSRQFRGMPIPVPVRRTAHQILRHPSACHSPCTPRHSTRTRRKPEPGRNKGRHNSNNNRHQQRIRMATIPQIHMRSIGYRPDDQRRTKPYPKHTDPVAQPQCPSTRPRRTLRAPTRKQPGTAPALQPVHHPQSTCTACPEQALLFPALHAATCASHSARALAYCACCASNAATRRA